MRPSRLQTWGALGGEHGGGVPGGLLQSHGRCPGAGWTWEALGVEGMSPPNPEGAGSLALVTGLTCVSGEACPVQEAVGTFLLTRKHSEEP